MVRQVKYSNTQVLSPIKQDDTNTFAVIFVRYGVRVLSLIIAKLMDNLHVEQVD